MKFKIKLLDDKIKEIRSRLESQSIKYSDLPKAGGFKDNLIELQTEILIELETKKEHLQMKIDIILDELSELPELTYKVVYYRHIDGLRWLDISKKLDIVYHNATDFTLWHKNLKYKIIFDN